MSELRKKFEKKAARWDDETDYVPVGVNGLVAASARLLAVNRGFADPDERDHLAFKQLITVPDLVRERIRIDEGKRRKKLFTNAVRSRNLANFPVNALGSPIRGQFISNPLSADSEQTNPMLGVEQLRRITQMGPGGIGSTNAITEDMVSLDASTFGFLSPIEGPECHSADTEVFTSEGWSLWSGVGPETKLATIHEDKMIFVKPERLVAEHYEGPMLGVTGRDISFLVTPNHRMLGRTSAGGYCFAEAEEHYNKNIFYKTGGVPWEGEENISPDWSSERCEILGWFMSAGFFKERNSTYPIVAIRIPVGKSLEEYNRLLALATLNFPTRVKVDEASGLIEIEDEQLAAHLKSFWFDDNDCFIPRELQSSKLGARQSLLRGLLLGESPGRGRDLKIKTCSARFAFSVSRLLTGLGHSNSVNRIENENQGSVKPRYSVEILGNSETNAVGGVEKHWFSMPYSGLVYCATVAGGLLLTRRNGGAAVWSGNSELIGIDTRLATGTRIGSDGRIYQRLRNRRTGISEYVSPADIMNQAVKIPD